MTTESSMTQEKEAFWRRECSKPVISIKFDVKPKWTDECNHTEGTFVGQATVFSRDPVTFNEIINHVYDIYFDAHDGNCHVCFRYGNDGPEYISPGWEGFVREYLLKSYKE
jgi:hypothetical protein